MGVGKLLSASDSERLKKRVQEAEASTWGELVPVVVHASDSYVGHRWLWSSTLALLVLVASAKEMVESGDAESSIHFFPYLLIAIWFLALAIFHFAFRERGLLLSRILRRDLKTQAVDRRVHLAFLEHGLHRAARSAGVLIFISWMERQIRIVADEGYNGKVTQAEWDAVRDLVVTKIRQGDLVGGLDEAIVDCGRLMKRAHPAAPGERGASVLDDSVSEE